ncbi:MAG: hypothetical protein NVS3B20_21540 [Polyangiales bacterium]
MHSAFAKYSRAIVQVGVLSAIYFACAAGTHALHAPVPGNVVGAVVLALALAFKIVPLRWVEDGADLLLRFLALLFVPPAVLVAKVIPNVRKELPAIALVLVTTTTLVLVVTGLLADRFGTRPNDDIESRR